MNKLNNKRETRIALGSGTGPTSNMFSVKNGRLMLNQNLNSYASNRI